MLKNVLEKQIMLFYINVQNWMALLFHRIKWDINLRIPIYIYSYSKSLFKGIFFIIVITPFQRKSKQYSYNH